MCRLDASCGSILCRRGSSSPIVSVFRRFSSLSVDIFPADVLCVMPQTRRCRIGVEEFFRASVFL
jgi:hypothetical protein